MNKFITGLLLAAAMQSVAYAQTTADDWHKNILQRLDTTRQDSSRVMLIAELANYYKYYLPDSTVFYGYKALELARKIDYAKGEVNAMIFMGFGHIMLGNDSKGLQVTLQALKIAEKNNLINEKANLLIQLGRIYSRANNHTKALEYIKKAKALSDSHHYEHGSLFAEISLVESFLTLNQPDSALSYCLSEQSAHEYARQAEQNWILYHTLINLGKIHEKKGNEDLAMDYFKRSLSVSGEHDKIFNANFSIAQLYDHMNNPDSGIYYANQSLKIIQGRGFYANIIKANILLASIYDRKDPQKALTYNRTALLYKDSLTNLAKQTSFEHIVGFDEQERQYEIDTANAAYRNQVKQYALLAGLLGLLLIAFLLYRNVRHRQKAFARLLKQKQETDAQKDIAERTLTELRSTQAQLIQREKMAGLGELAAGIAHEIQNPLNFVNNFSEVNKELLTEMKGEIDNGNLDEVRAIANDVMDNQEKINHHGKRADAIVKGMLQHSHSSLGVKEPVNVNKLTDEYFRLAYHGLRAKDKTLNVTLKTEFDESMGNIRLIPQDIGRVIVNLINNAFYAVTEKKKQGAADYEPTVTATTRKLNNGVEINVKDNGIGIPQKLVDKIFQPFFTTKPTGQGTGLGLSLAYDIIKAHGGEIKVVTKENEGTEFSILLPALG